MTKTADVSRDRLDAEKEKLARFFDTLDAIDKELPEGPLSAPRLPYTSRPKAGQPQWKLTL